MAITLKKQVSNNYATFCIESKHTKIFNYKKINLTTYKLQKIHANL